MAYETKGTLLYTATGIAEKYDPVISEHFNNDTTFYARTLKKPSQSIDHRFVARVGRNDMVGPKTSTDDLIGSSSNRINLTSVLRQYAAAVSIEDARVIEAQRNGIGPLANAWATEMNDTMVDLSKNLNIAFLSAGTTLGTGFGDAVDSLGALLQSSGNVYGQSRTTYPSLAANVAATVGDLSLTGLRTYITTLKVKGGKNFVIYTTPTVATYLKNKMEAAKMYIGTSSAAGFEGSLVFDGIPIVEDADMPAGVMYILDQSEYYIAEFVPFSMGQKELGKTNLTDTKYIWGILNLIIRRMDVHYKISGITS
jgi:hypothetical protein